MTWNRISALRGDNPAEGSSRARTDELRHQRRGHRHHLRWPPLMMPGRAAKFNADLRKQVEHGIGRLAKDGAERDATNSQPTCKVLQHRHVAEDVGLLGHVSEAPRCTSRRTKRRDVRFTEQDLARDRT